MTDKAYDIEYVAKAQMAAKLNLLMSMEPSFVLQLVATYHVVSNQVGSTTFEVESPNKDNAEVLLNLMGILNGLVGKNVWRLVLDRTTNNPVFKVIETDPSQYLSQSYIKEHKPYTKLETKGD